MSSQIAFAVSKFVENLDEQLVNSYRRDQVYLKNKSLFRNKWKALIYISIPFVNYQTLPYDEVQVSTKSVNIYLSVITATTIFNMMKEHRNMKEMKYT